MVMNDSTFMDLISDLHALSTFGEGSSESFEIIKQIVEEKDQCHRSGNTEKEQRRRSVKLSDSPNPHRYALPDDLIPEECIDYESCSFNFNNEPGRDITNTFRSYSERHDILSSINAGAGRNETIEAFANIELELGKKSDCVSLKKEEYEKSSTKEPGTVSSVFPTIALPQKKKDKKKKNALLNALKNTGKLDEVLRTRNTKENSKSDVKYILPVSDFVVDDSEEKLDVTDTFLYLKSGEPEVTVLLNDDMSSNHSILRSESEEFMTPGSESSSQCSTVREWLSDGSNGSSPSTSSATSEKKNYHKSSKRSLFIRDVNIGFGRSAGVGNMKRRQDMKKKYKNSNIQPEPNSALPETVAEYIYVPEIRNLDYEYRPQDFPKLKSKLGKICIVRPV